LCLFKADKLPWNKNQRTFVIVIFLLAIISAQSTTGYIATVAIIGVYVISQRDNIKGRFVMLSVLFVALLGWNFVSVGNESFVSSVILNKLFNIGGEFDINASTGYWRMLVINISMNSLKVNPLGCGYDMAHMLIKKYAEGAAGNALFVGIMALGYEFIGVLVYSLLIPAYKNKKNIFTFILVVFLYINTAIAQPNAFFPALVLLCIMNFKEIPNDKYNENNVVYKQHSTGNIAQLNKDRNPFQ
jgi:hypothetical protein